MPWLMAFMTRLYGRAVKYTLAVQFTRITFPYLVFIALRLFTPARSTHIAASLMPPPFRSCSMW